MPIRNVQAISGVSAGVENIVMTVYPSIAATGIGRLLGRLYDCIPLKIGGVKLSNLLFTLPTAPIATLMYFGGKVAGPRFVLTNRRLTVRTSLGERLLLDIALPAIDEIDVIERDGQAFYRAADLVVYDAGGKVLGRLEGVPRAEIFRQTILEARDSQMSTASALATIQARQPA